MSCRACNGEHRPPPWPSHGGGAARPSAIRDGRSVMGRALLENDAVEAEFNLLDEISRSRALSETESRRLEQIIRQLDGRKRERQRRLWGE